ncbi:MAG TPA: hypothetical protein H9976_07750 [Candidatus Akkermansia intestinavium]|nr:hypothetical protein [Candidatus Akkermansia intestinavium]
MKQLLNNTEDPSAAETADAIAGAAAFGASLALISTDTESRDTALTSPAAVSTAAAAEEKAQGADATAPAGAVATPAVPQTEASEHLEPAP